VGADGDRVVYLWIVPANVAGDWRLTFDTTEEERAVDLKLTQIISTHRACARLPACKSWFEDERL
jgi:hypothetical protein